MVVLSRWETIKLAARMFWFATGTSRVGVSINDNGIELLGKDLI